MIGREKRMLLRHYLKEGLSKSEISRRLDMSRDTIHRLIRSGQLDRDLDAEPVRYKPRSPVVTKLDPCRALIMTRLEAYPRLSSVRLLEEVRAAGYTGGYTQVKEFVRTVRPREAPEPVVRSRLRRGTKRRWTSASSSSRGGSATRWWWCWGTRGCCGCASTSGRTCGRCFGGLRKAFCLLRRCAAGAAVRSDEGGDHPGPTAAGGAVGDQRGVPALRRHWGFKARACRPYRAQT